MGARRDVTDSRCAGRKRRRRNQKLITLSLGRTPLHASPRKGIPIGIGPREPISESLEEGNNLVLLFIGQAELAGRHVEVVLDLGLRPAGNLLDSSGGAVPRGHRKGDPFHVARVVEVDELFQALDVAVVKELLLEVGSRRLGRRTLWWCHSHIARRRHLHLAVGGWCKFSPTQVRVGSGTKNTTEESP